MTIQEIADRAIARENPDTNTPGYLTRIDVYDALKTYNDKEKEIENITTFLNMLPFLKEKDKQDVLSDLGSYRY